MSVSPLKHTVVSDSCVIQCEGEQSISSVSLRSDVVQLLHQCFSAAFRVLQLQADEGTL